MAFANQLFRLAPTAIAAFGNDAGDAVGLGFVVAVIERHSLLLSFPRRRESPFY